MEEEQYLNTLRKALNSPSKPNRTINLSRSFFGNLMRFTLYNEITGKKILPLITTKDMNNNIKSILKELEFFIHGQTDSKILHQSGVKIWDANSSRQYLDLIGLTNYQEGDLGPVYGWNWRHYGAEYKDCQTDYFGKGIDQLQIVIDEIQKNPGSRRLLVSSWDPTKLNQVVLPACHVLFQFNVSFVDLTKNKLDCLIYQRSADLPLGVPFNIASYAILTHLIAEITGLLPGDLIYITGDNHIYENQISLVAEQISRKPLDFPELIIDKSIQNINQFYAENIKIKNYQSYPAIYYPFSV